MQCAQYICCGCYWLVVIMPILLFVGIFFLDTFIPLLYFHTADVGFSSPEENGLVELIWSAEMKVHDVV